MDPSKKRWLLRDFADWARARELEEDGHDARFRGALGDAVVEIETGIRDSGAYLVRVAVHLSAGISPCVLRRTASSAAPEAASRLRECFEHRALLSIRVEPDVLSLRLSPGSTPNEVEAVIDAVTAAVSRASGPYR